MTPEDARAAAGLLLEARRSRKAIDSLPAGLRPDDLEGAYAIQAAFVAEAAGLPGQATADAAQVGYKIGATSRKAQDYLGVEGPFFGRILRGGVVESPSRFAAGDFLFCLIEPEFAFRLAAPLPPRPQPYGEDEVAEAVAAVHPAIELVTSAFGAGWSGAGARALIADNGVHGAFVLGPACDDWRKLDLPAHPVSLSINGAAVSEGRGANALGGPLTALTWLANELGARGAARPLAAGDWVTTGVVTDFKLLEPGDEAVADFGGLGQVRLSLSA